MSETESSPTTADQPSTLSGVVLDADQIKPGYVTPGRREDGKMLVTMIQSPDKQTRRVRIGDLVEFDVLASGMIPGDGQTNYNFTIANIEIAYDKVRDAAG